MVLKQSDAPIYKNKIQYLPHIKFGMDHRLRNKNSNQQCY